MVARPGQVILIYDLPKIALQSWDRAATPMISSAGICPFDQNIFSDDEVLCSFVSDRHGLQFENPLSALKQENNLLLEQSSEVHSEDFTERSQE